VYGPRTEGPIPTLTASVLPRGEFRFSRRLLSPRLAYVSEHLAGPATTAAGIVDVLLHRNQLSIIGNLSGSLPALQQLTLFANPLHCHCRNDWIQQTVTRLYVLLTARQTKLVAWHSGRTSVSGRRTFPVLRSTCS